MRSVAVLLVALLSTGLPSRSNAEEGVTTGEMMEHCQKPDGHFFKTYCFTYVAAVIDMQTLYALSDSSGPRVACIPPHVVARQASAVFVQWATQNPARQHIPAATGVVESMVHAFPCSAP